MCWQDWKIGAKLRQVRTDAYRDSGSGGTFTLGPDRRRFGLVFHGPIGVTVYAKRSASDPLGDIIFQIAYGSDQASPFSNIPVPSRVATVAEFGGDIRGAIEVAWSFNGVDGNVTINELQWCGPESIDEGL